MTLSNHDAIAVQICLSAGIPTDQVDPLLSRIVRRLHTKTVEQSKRQPVYAAPQPTEPHPPILYQHADGRYGLCLHGQPAKFTMNDPEWYRVPIDVVEPTSGQPSGHQKEA